MESATEAAAPAGRVIQVATIDASIEQCEISKRNPRQHFDDRGLDDLVTSITQHGILQPLLAREVSAAVEQQARFEILEGGRRYRAARKAKLTTLPLRLVACDDDTALEIMVVANVDREDLHPLDEAAGYRALLDTSRYADVAALAARFGKSESYYYQRLALLKLIAPMQKLFLEDVLSAAHALLIARLQEPQQRELLEQLKERQKQRWEPMTAADLRHHIERQFMLDLKGAPFDTKDAALVEGAGTCAECPKRTGFSPALFPDVTKKDTCTDPGCYRAKLLAQVDRRRAELGAAETEYVELDDRHTGAKKGPIDRSRWEPAKSGSCGSIQTGLVVDGNKPGTVVAFCADRKCKKHHGAGASHAASRSAEDRNGRQRREKEKAVAEGAARIAILDAIVGKVTGDTLELPLMRLLAATAATRTLHDDLKKLLRRYPWASGKKELQDPRATALSRIPKMKPVELIRFLVEVALIADCGTSQYGSAKPERLMAAAKLLKVDAAAVRRASAREQAFKTKAKLVKRETPKGEPKKRAKKAA